MSHQSFSQMKPIFHLLSQPVFLLENGIVTYCNPAAASLLVQEGDTAEAFFPDGIAAPAAGSQIHTTVRLSGKLYHALLHPLSGALLCLVGDAAKNAAIGQDYLSVVAAQIRKPLGDLFSAAKRLLLDLDSLEQNSAEERQACLIFRALYQLQRLAGQLSDGSQLAQGLQTLCPERTELKQFLDDLAQTAEDMLDYVGIRLRYTGLSCPQYGDIDRQKLERAIWNLIANAATHSSADGVIEFSAETTETSLVIRVTDHGDGISDAVKPAVFNRFAHHPGLTDGRDGAGFGLSIVRQIAILHGGSAMLCSLPNGGTAVTMSVSLLHNPPMVHSAKVDYDYADRKNHALVELSDVLPYAAFHPLDLEY